MGLGGHLETLGDDRLGGVDDGGLVGLGDVFQQVALISGAAVCQSGNGVCDLQGGEHIVALADSRLQKVAAHPLFANRRQL